MKMLNASRLRRLINGRAEEDVAEGKLGKAEIIVNQNGERVFHGFFGGAKAGDVYRLASMTKPVTAVTLLREMDAGRVGLDDLVGKYLPEFRTMQVGHAADGKAVVDGEAATVLRLYMLLCHTSGIHCGTLAAVTPGWEGSGSLAESVARFAAQPLSFEPDTANAYSTAAFDVAARIVELTSGVPCADYLRQFVTGPLGMPDTTYAPTAAQWARMTEMHDRTTDGRSITVERPAGCVFEDHRPEVCSAGAGLAGTAEDYSRFAEMLRRGGTAEDGTRILSENAVARMRTPFVPESRMNASERWGLGVRVITRPDYPHGLPVGTFGWSGAYGTHFWVDPENQITAVYMKNTVYDGGAGNRTACHFEEDVTASLDA